MNSGNDFCQTTTVEFEKNWQHLPQTSNCWSKWKFSHQDKSTCNCGLDTKMTWADACRIIQTKIKQNRKHEAHFHPQTIVDCRPHKVATGHKTCCFSIHVDDLNVRHAKVKGTSYTTFGVQIHNVKSETQRHEFFIRTCFMRNDKQIWSKQQHLQIIGKELETLKKGMPIPVEGSNGKFELVHFVCLGVIADGPEIGKLLGRTGLKGYCGNQLIRENLSISKCCVGTNNEPVFTARRYLTNKV